MSRNDLNMEEWFRTQMDSFRVDPSPGLWQKVHAKLFWKQFLSFGFQTFNVYYLAAAITLAGIGTAVWLSKSQSGGQEQAVPSGTEIRTDTPQQTSPDVAAPVRETIKSQVADPADDKSSTRVKDLDAKKDAVSLEKEAEGQLHSLPPFKEKQGKADRSKPEAAVDDPEGKKSEILRVSVDFTPSRFNGCSPLAVEFENLSVNAEKYSWTFGDGGSSGEEHPSYVFDVPGEYPVILKITGEDGLEYSKQQTIRVFETPRALFEMEEVADISENQPVYFYNYSRGADYYEWDFGDHERSNLAEPVHYYARPGNYDVKLKVWTVNHCSDSLVILNAFTGADGEIRFPTAFTPNLNGPIGGYYEPNDFNNYVFHPVVKGELVEYRLKIFNRQGLQIFETTDVHIGWDGYYQEKLAAQAVYIWKARGKFSNGKTFVKSGDVTLIRH